MTENNITPPNKIGFKCKIYEIPSNNPLFSDTKRREHKNKIGSQ